MKKVRKRPDNQGNSDNHFKKKTTANRKVTHNMSKQQENRNVRQQRAQALHSWTAEDQEKHRLVARSITVDSGYLQHNNTPCHNGEVISDWFHEPDSEFSVFQCPTATRSESNRAPVGMW